MRVARLVLFFFLTVSFLSVIGQDEAVSLRGRIIDARSGEMLPARLYIESLEKDAKLSVKSLNEQSRFFLAKSASENGSAAPYEKKRGEKSIEIHTCLSAHPFEAELPPGKYLLTAERGHEYLTAQAEIEIGDEPAEIELKLERWIHLADRGWFSGDTHCHRTLDELPTVLLAEDLNVGLPLTSWVSDTSHTPAENNRNPDPVPPPEEIRVDETHVIWPVNTEYEIGSVDKERHVLGAIFFLNHQQPLELPVPPVGPVAEEARKQGAIIDLDKHNWPWSMMLVPIAQVNLFELTNNHVWRTEFAFTDWYTDYVGEFMNVPLRDEEEAKPHLNEQGWLDFGFKNYYALLNCGLRILPSGGTASGVHPVPLGFGRVYARLPDGEFSYEGWIKALRSGDTFVTTGPMLFATVAEQHPGSKIDWDPEEGIDEESGVPVMIRVESQHSIKRLELVVNGDIVDQEIGGSIGARAPHSCFVRTSVEIDRSSWIAARVFTETPEGRPRFAHTAPVWVNVKDKPIRPKLLEADYLHKRVRAEIERHEGVLSKEALAEFEKAAEFFDKKRDEALK